MCEINHSFVGCIPNRGAHFTATRCVVWRALVNMDCVHLFHSYRKQQRLLDLLPRAVDATAEILAPGLRGALHSTNSR